MAVLVASGIAFLGVAIMVVGSIGHGSIDGDLFAMLMTLGYALMIVMMRRWQHISMMPAVLVGTMLAVLASTPLARPLAPGWQDFVWLAPRSRPCTPTSSSAGRTDFIATKCRTGSRRSTTT